ncbi:MAG TPA: hypothetical protein VLE47_04440 [Candidatus Saccharimonadales bacterium]|nr:hypothetical protein [Candidatus Saccharimonadales bacterium]
MEEQGESLCIGEIDREELMRYLVASAKLRNYVVLTNPRKYERWVVDAAVLVHDIYVCNGLPYPQKEDELFGFTHITILSCINTLDLQGTFRQKGRRR